MIRVYAVNDAPILLGRNGEHDVREVVFDIGDWLNDYGEGYAQLAVHRHSEEDHYLVPLTREGCKVSWVIKAPDVGVVGQGGECELSWYTNDDAFVKSQTWQTTVLAALNGEQIDAPDVAQAWLDATREQAARTQRAADAAKKSEQNAAFSERRSAESARAAFDAVDSLLEVVEAGTLFFGQGLVFTSEDASDAEAAFYYRSYGIMEDSLRLAEMEPGMSYRVIWEDGVYTCVAEDYSYVLDGEFAVKKNLLLGNKAKLSEENEDTGEPFLIQVTYLEGWDGSVLCLSANIITRPCVAAETVTRDVGIYAWDGFTIRGECLPDGVGIAVDTTLTEPGMAADSATVGERLKALEALMQELAYEAISITSFKSSVTQAEIGSTVEAVTLTWVLNKTPATLTLNDEMIDPALTSMALTDLGLTEGKVWRLSATDDRGATTSQTVSLSFLNSVYYGAAPAPGDVDGTFIRGLRKVLASSKGRTVTVDAGPGEYIWYAVPARMGGCRFVVNGFEGGFNLVHTGEITNASGYTESYYVYRSSNANLGSTKVEVS